MSMFKVYGVTIQVAKKKAEKKFEQLPLKEKAKFDPARYADWIDTETKAFYDKMSPVAIGKGFDAPQFAEELIAVSKKTTTCRAMHVRIHVPKTDSKGGIVLNKKTNQPSLTWEKYDPEKDYRETINALNRIKEAAYYGEVA